MSPALTSGDLGEALRAICGAAARALEVERTGVWLFDDAHEHLRSAVLFDASSDSFLPEIEISAAANPPYFAALEQQRIIAADDVYADPRTAMFADGYLRPHGISSMLDAPVRLRGRLLGTICHEHVGPARTWGAEEQRFVASLGDLVALALVADERACAELALRESESRYRLLVDGARDIVFELDAQGAITSVNPAFHALLGRAPGDWLGRHFGAVIHRDDLPLALDLFARAVGGESLPVFELRLAHASGDAVWLEFTIAIRSDAGRVLSVFGIGRDITARKRAEARRRVVGAIAPALASHGDDLARALAAVHRDVAAALPCSRVATVLRDAETGALTTFAHGEPSAHASAPAADGDGFPPRELVLQTLERGDTTVFHADVAGVGAVAARPQTLAATALRSAAGTIGVLVALRGGGGGFDAEQIELCEAAARELALAIAAARRRREEQDAAEVAAALARVGHELIASVDLPVLLQRLCRVTAEVLGCDVSHTFLRDDAEGSFELVAAHGHEPQDVEALRAVPVLDRDARGILERLQREHVAVARAGEGSIAGHLWEAYGTGSAIVIGLWQGSRFVGTQTAAYLRGRGEFGSRQIQIARGIAQLASLAIANARLVRELETASRVKSDFVATMSHELRTPLNVILGYDDLLVQEDLGPLAPEQREALERIRASAMELLELIEATLDLSRLEAGKAALDVAEIDLAAWLAEIADETSSLCERKPEIHVEWRLQPPGARVRSDAVKLKVVLKNLFANAIKFTHEGAVDVAVAVDGDVLEIVVRDTGIGMSSEVRAVIFEAFRQGDASATRRYGGVGLGLYIASRLVDALRRAIEVESVPGLGSTFRVRVPADARARHAGRGHPSSATEQGRPARA
ncbi:MAG: GAF domain-containing protein [Thermodesulfobacteriota bacterium]